MDDELAVPLDGVVQPRPAAVVLHAGVAPRGDQEARDVLVPGTRPYLVLCSTNYPLVLQKVPSEDS